MGRISRNQTKYGGRERKFIYGALTLVPAVFGSAQPHSRSSISSDLSASLVGNLTALSSDATISSSREEMGSIPDPFRKS